MRYSVNFVWESRQLCAVSLLKKIMMLLLLVQDMRDVRQHLRVPGLDLRLLFSR